MNHCKSELFLHQQQVDFLEIVAERYLDTTTQKEQELELLAAHFPLIPHAINLSLGSAEDGSRVDVNWQDGTIVRTEAPIYGSDGSRINKGQG